MSVFVAVPRQKRAVVGVIAPSQPPPPPPQLPPPPQQVVSKLTLLHTAAAIVHTTLAIGFGLYFTSKLWCETETELLPLSVFTHSRVRETGVATVPIPTARERGRFSETAIAAAIVAFFAVTAVAHAFYALDFGGVYSAAVASGANPFRWAEYAVSATIMTVVIAAVSGVRDLYAVVLLAIATVVIMSTGYWFETVAVRSDTSFVAKVAPLAAGFALLAGVWYVVISSYRDRVEDADEARVEIPSWIIAAVLTTLIFFSSFGVVPVVQLVATGGSPAAHVASFGQYETTYVALSFAAKATLASFIAYGLGERIDAANKPK